VTTYNLKQSFKCDYEVKIVAVLSCLSESKSEVKCTAFYEVWDL